MKKDKTWYRNVLLDEINNTGEISQWYNGYKRGLRDAYMLSAQIEEPSGNYPAWVVVVPFFDMEPYFKEFSPIKKNPFASSLTEEQDEAEVFIDKEQAEAVAKLTGGKIKEI